jgi:DNA excision repair protein ERCC-2
MDGAAGPVLCSANTAFPKPTTHSFMAHARKTAMQDLCPHPNSRYEVGVRVLCEFTAKRGDLDLRFTPSPSAEEGVAGHRVMAARRGAHYQKEVALAGDFGLVHVRGRADGYDPHANQLEEFKTYRGDLNRIPLNHRALHWAQLRIYGWLLCQERGCTEIRLALVYFDIASEEETALVEVQSAHALEQHFAEHCQRFADWAESEASHRRCRDRALHALCFPFASFRAEQRQLAAAVYRTVLNGRALLAQAPTGIGKTIGTLFPALKAMPSARLDKLFYLVAKTSGRVLALDTLRRLKASGVALPLRVVELVARKRACEYPQNTCDAAGCPLARGFYDRLPAARAEAMTLDFLDQASVRALALKHGICPYYLAQELVRWSDVVVGDYNYYFDLNAVLYGWTIADGWRICVQVDEAHNLIERARMMYTTALDQSAFDAGRRCAPLALKKSFAAVNRAWRSVVKAQERAYCVHDHVPQILLSSLEDFIIQAGDHISRNPPRQEDKFLEVFFDVVRFCRLASALDSGTIFEVTKMAAVDARRRAQNGSAFCLRNILPRRFLAGRFLAAHAAVLFSATLAPADFYRDVLGLPKATDWMDVRSPFHPEQLTVKLVPSISTRYRDRARSRAPIAALIAAQYQAQPGNYLAFFSSFEYLNSVAALVETHYPGIALWKQAREMTEPERRAYLARFVADGSGVGFAVLGGAFAEGVDLPGSRLVGAFIATLGLPPVNAVNDEVQRRMAAMFGAGYEYTYLYPGVRKVVQAAGRVIRAPSDRGVLYLIDDRFTRAEVRKLLPAWWRINDAAPFPCS